MNTDLPPTTLDPANAPPGPAVTLDFRSLDPRVIQLWRVRQLITSAVLLGIGLVSVVSVGVATGAWLWLWLGFAALVVLRVILFFWYPARAYQGWGYRLEGSVLETREGIWFRSLTLLPLSRLQHVDLHSGPIQRSFGLASLLLHTAGTQHATIVIPGLDAAEAARLRDQLVAVGGDDAV
jgi:uncharacterized protein